MTTLPPQAQVTACPRCGGRLLPFAHGERYCLACGWVQYLTPGTADDLTPFVKGKRRYGPVHKGRRL